MFPKPEDIAQDVYDRHINQRVILNVFRASHVEAMVLRALGKAYQLTEGWEAWDIVERVSGRRIEVKQSAALQTWRGPKSRSRASYDIAERKLQYVGVEAVTHEPPQRLADLYIFAWHGDESDRCDHRDPQQWEFLVVLAESLPKGQKSITRGSLTSKFGQAGWIAWSDLAATVTPALNAIRCTKERHIG